MQSQVYKIALYVIYDNDSRRQGKATPYRIIALQKKLVQAEKDGKITDLYLSPSIKVTLDDNEFYIQI